MDDADVTIRGYDVEQYFAMVQSRGKPYPALLRTSSSNSRKDSMNSSETAHVETTLRSGSEAIHALTRGSGPKLLVLHEEMGYPGPLGWEADLARDRQLI